MYNLGKTLYGDLLEKMINKNKKCLSVYKTSKMFSKPELMKN